MKQRFAIIFLVLSCFVAMQVYADNVKEKYHRDWRSRIIHVGSEERYRAYTISQKNIILTLDRRETDCQSIFVTMNVLHDSPSTITDVSEKLWGQMRVDEKAIHNVSYEISMEKGDDITFISFIDFDRGYDIIKDIEQGRTLRVKLSLSGKDFFLAFSLSGSTSALNRSLRLCQTYAHRYQRRKPAGGYDGNKNNKDYFQNKDYRRNKSDAEYF